MIYLIIVLGLVFIGTGFILTENNAKHLLAGYNTMSREEQEKVNLKKFIPYFRNFHIFLGLSFLLLGLLLNNMTNKKWVGIYVGIYPLLAYIYFIWNSAKFTKGIENKNTKIGIFILLVVIVLMAGLFYIGSKEDKLVLSQETIELEGMYGEVIQQSDIESIELVPRLPKIRMRVSGFALGDIYKGYFKTGQGENIKLILNSSNTPYLLIKKSDGKEIYFSAKETSNEKILNDLKKAFPEIPYKQ